MPWASGDSLSPSILNLRGGGATLATGFSTDTLQGQSGLTVDVISDLSVQNTVAAQRVELGGAPSNISGLVSLRANSQQSDYFFFQDSVGLKSNFLLGLRTGDSNASLVDGLNLYDTSHSTMIVRFSSDSVRFYPPIVAPVFDTGGALASTYNAALFLRGSSRESQIQAAINGAAADGVKRVYVPANLYPYSSGSITFNTAVQMVREGGSWDGYDVLAYGAYGDFSHNDTPAFAGAINGARVAGGSRVVVPPPPSAGTYLLGAAGSMVSLGVLELYGKTAMIGLGGGAISPAMQLANDVNLDVLQLNKDAQGCRVENLVIDGNKSNQTGTSHGLRLRNDGVLKDLRHIFYNVFIQNCLTDGFHTDSQANGFTAIAITARDCGGNGFNIASADGSFFGCGVNTCDLDGFLCQVGYNRFVGCQAYKNGQYNVHIGATAEFTRFNDFDADSAGFNNYEVLASNSLLLGCFSRDPGRLTTNTYPHIRIASGLSSVQVVNPIFQKRSGSTTATYLIYCAGTLDNSHIDIGSWESSSASNGVLFSLGQLTNVQVTRPPDVQTWSSGDSKPDVSGSFKFTSPTLFFTNNASTTTIHSLTGGQEGQEATIVFTDTNSIILHSASSISLAAGQNIRGIVGDSLSVKKGAGIWREVASGSGVARLGSGTALQPTYAFGSETSLGFYRSTTSTILQSYGTFGASVYSSTAGGGSVEMRLVSGNAIRSGSAGGTYFFDAGAVSFRDGNGSGADGWVRTGLGTLAKPSYAFDSEVSLGFYRSAASTMALSYGSLNLNQARLVSVRTQGSLDSTTLAQGELAISIAVASGASLALRSGNTIYYWTSSASTKG